MNDDSAKITAAEQADQEERLAFVHAFNQQQRLVHLTAINKGWWDNSEEYKTAISIIKEHVTNKEDRNQALDALAHLDKRNDGEMLCLMHTELSEALDALRHGNPADDKVPEYDSLTVELADVLIRVMDFAEFYNLPLAEAVVAKMEMNRGREYKHGNKKF